jgi:hypothetical protein
MRCRCAKPARLAKDINPAVIEHATNPPASSLSGSTWGKTSGMTTVGAAKRKWPKKHNCESLWWLAAS